MNNVGSTHRIGCVQRWVTPSGPGPRICQQVRTYRVFGKTRYEHAHLNPLDRPVKLTPQNPSGVEIRFPWNHGSPLGHARLTGDASPACLAGSPVLRSGVAWSTCQ